MIRLGAFRRGLLGVPRPRGVAMKEFAVRELTLGQVFDASVEAFPLREAVVHPGTGVR